MRYIKFIVVAIITIALTWALDNSLNIKGKVTPPLMPLINPMQGYWANVAQAQNFQDETLDFPQLNDKVQVIWDERLVPHIFAQNKEDAFFVQGYLTAKLRYFQMDLMQRDAAGKLSEIIGKAALPRDKMRRHQGIKYAAEKAVKGWKKFEDYRFVDKYIQGVNAHFNKIDDKNKPLEYKLLGYEPEAWNAVKSALVVKNMALSLCFRNSDIAATNTLKKIGAEQYDFLFPDWNPKQSPIIPAAFHKNINNENARNTKDTKPEIGYLQHQPFPNPPENIGSNNWAVAAEKSATGNPILCNDPHLNLSLPAIWLELQIHTPDFNAYGVSVPGIPGILIGFNENIAWGETNVGHDIVDWYIPKWTDKTKDYYLFDNKPQKTEKRIEVIKIKGEKDIIDTVRYTHLGPVAFNESYGDLVIRWLVLDEPNTTELSTFLDLMQSKNYDDYEKALKPYISPAQNFIFASKDNDIAITVNGRLPLKEKGEGKFVQNGDSSKNVWSGYILNEDIPRMKNPERGFVSSANQHSTDSTYPYYYHSTFEDYRGRYLNRKLANQEKWSIEDMKALQGDNYSLRAEETLPLLLKYLDKNELNTTEKSYLSTVAKWNYKYDATEKAPIIFDAWWNAFYGMAWDEFEEEGYTLQSPEYWRTIDLMENKPDLPYWDIQSTPKKESINAIVLMSFKKAVKTIEQSQKTEDNYTDYTDFYIKHLLLLEPFNRNHLKIGGNKSALNANSPGNGPSWRMIVELGEQPNALGVYPGGQSGNPASPYYDNMLDTWAKNEYYKLHLYQSPEDIKEGVLFKQNLNNTTE